MPSPESDHDEPPVVMIDRVSSWVDVVVVRVALAVTGLGITSVLLAWRGWMRPVPLVLVGGCVVAGLVWLSRDVTLPPTRGRASAMNVLMVVGLGVLGIVNASAASEHLFTDSDPGVYANAARYLADEGTLLLDSAEGPFADQPGLHSAGGGQYDVRGDGLLYFQFFHFLSGLMAIGGWIGGNLLLLRIPALFAALALMLFHLLARSFMGTVLAGAMTLALAVNPIQLFFSRDSYSEVTSQMLVLLGLVLLVSAARRPSAGTSVLAGVALGATAFSRVDASVVLLAATLIGLVPLYASSASRAERRHALGFLAALVVVSTVGFRVGYWLSPVYWGDLGHLVEPLLILQAILLGLGLVLVPVVAAVRLRMPEVRRSLALSVAAGSASMLVLAGGLFAYYVRPEVLEGSLTKPRPTIANELAEVGLEPDPLRSLSEFSLQWITWYVGGPAVLLGIVGLAAMIWIALTRGDRVYFAVAALVGASLVARVVRPAIVPVHYWAMRRFYVIVIPGLLLLAGWIISELAKRIDAKPARLAVAAVLVVPTLTGVLVLNVDTWTHRQQIGLRTTAVAFGCDGDRDQAYLMVDDVGGVTAGPNYVTMFQTFCGSPAVWTTRPIAPETVSTLAAGWDERGVELVLVSTAERTRLIDLGVPDCGVVSTQMVNQDVPELTLFSVPRSKLDQRITFHFGSPGEAC